MMNVEPVVVGIVERDDFVLIAKRRPEVFLGGLWEFPGGKVELGETSFDALVRELKEEVAIDVQGGYLWHQDTVIYSDREVSLEFWKVTDFLGEPISNESQEVRWVSVSSLMNFEFPPGSLAVVEKMIKTHSCQVL